MEKSEIQKNESKGAVNRMADIQKVIRSLDDSKKNLHCGFVDGIGDVYAVSEETINDTLKLLKEQQGIITELLKVGYPHNFQNEKPHITNYMWKITEVMKKAVHFQNG